MSHNNEGVVLGHSCPGLVGSMTEADGCVPGFTEIGAIEGCDDTNWSVIKFCPYCGALLLAVTSVIFDGEETDYGKACRAKTVALLSDGSRVVLNNYAHRKDEVDYWNEKLGLA